MSKPTWKDMNMHAVAAIEIATGICFNRRGSPPTGLYSRVIALQAEAERRWPEERTVGQMASLYLEQRLEHRSFLEKSAA